MRNPLSYFLLFGLLAGCSPEKHTADFAAPGPYGVGVRTLAFVDSTRPTPANRDFAGAATRSLKVEVWHPAAPAAPAAPGSDEGPARDVPVLPGGPFPLILHSHGLQDSRTGENYLAEHLASHGYLVAAPDFPLSRGGAPGGATANDVAEQPRDLRFVLDQLLADGSIGPAVDKERIAASGLSLGGMTTLLVAFHPQLRDPRIRAALPIAAPACMFLPGFFTGARLPMLLLHGDSDFLVPLAANAGRAFERAQAGSTLATLRRGSHTGFSAVATLFNSTQHYDRIGCAAIAGSVENISFPGLGGEADGVSSDPAVCPRPCQPSPDEVGSAAALDAGRQHELTRVFALSFFEGALKDDGAARRFIEAAAQAENEEVEVRKH